ncbi:hypothetical protein BC936DRAFT_141186 [Jimgerdemannia flammicorona]|uniref:Uncharacterized protein n=1 Tax=Jimgerdemannia flammicorona TaxID=994334 RepID=A0A433A2R0_9FUNG|nr:hypothetical protein BC936DRAFT_141186 [Jimgerdemannia flammicorona]
MTPWKRHPEPYVSRANLPRSMLRGTTDRDREAQAERDDGPRGGQGGRAHRIVRLSLENIQPISNYLRMSYTSIHTAHDEAKDKEFELELSWVCEESNGRHQFVPKTIAEEAERLAKESMNEEMDDD